MSKNFAMETIRARKNQGMSLRELAHKTWISPHRMSEIERGADPERHEAVYIVRALKSDNN